MLNALVTMTGAARLALAEAMRMKSRSPQAAGILIALGAIIGFVWGLTRGEANWWTLVGTLIGAALALLLWLAERRKS